MFDSHGVQRKLYLSIEIVFWLIKYLLKLIIFWSKLLKNDENDQNAYVNICQKTIDMIVIFSQVVLYPLGHFSPKYHGCKHDITEPPLDFSQQLPFLAFLGAILTYQTQNIKIQSTPVLLTKNLENVCHALKSPHPKYHVIIITRS